jgi:hypothetical protein
MDSQMKTEQGLADPQLVKDIQVEEERKLREKG